MLNSLGLTKAEMLYFYPNDPFPLLWGVDTCRKGHPAKEFRFICARGSRDCRKCRAIRQAKQRLKAVNGR